MLEATCPDVKHADPTRWAVRYYKIVDASRSDGRHTYAPGKTTTATDETRASPSVKLQCYSTAANCYEDAREYARPLRYLRVTPSSIDLRGPTNASAPALFVDAELTSEEWIALIHKEYTAKACSPAKLALAGADCNHVRTVEHALAVGAPPDMNMLAAAALAGSVRVARVLIPEMAPRAVLSTAEWCARLGSVRALETLFACGVALDYPDLLTWAAIGRGYKAIRWIVRQGEWRCMATLSIMTTLQLLIQGNMQDAVKIFIDGIVLYNTPEILKGGIKHAETWNRPEIKAMLEGVVLEPRKCAHA